MKFCNVCDNMFYMSCEDKNLVYYCKNCSNRFIESVDTLSRPIIESKVADDDINFTQYMTVNIEHDVTLPHIHTIRCPNTDCTKPTDAKNDVMFAKYDHRNLKYIYYCVHCKQFWKSGTV